MTSRKEFLTKDAELKYLRERVSYLELENENLRLKLKLAETEKLRPEEKKRKYVLIDPFFGEFPFERPASSAPKMEQTHGSIPVGPEYPGPYGFEINDIPWWFRQHSTAQPVRIVSRTSSKI